MDDSIWKLTWEAFKSSWKSLWGGFKGEGWDEFLEQINYRKSIYDFLINIVIPLNKDAEMLLQTDISDYKFNVIIRNKKKSTEIPTEEELNEEFNKIIKNNTEKRNE